MKYVYGKKKFFLGITAVLAVTVLLATACIIDKDKGDYDYVGVGNDYSITRYRGKGGNIEIPETIDGHTITGIADEAFANDSDITGVIIAQTINYIGNRAFKNCANLESVTIKHTGSHVTISSESFNCPKLTRVTFNGTASLLDDSFLGDLHTKKDTNQLVGPGTYTRSGSTWTKQ